MNFRIISIFLLSSLLFLSCGKRSINYLNTDNGQNVNASIFGQVIDETGIPIRGAIVSTGSHSSITDSNGIFQFFGVTTSNNKTVIQVKKQNYFNGYRTMHIIPNEDNYSRIMMIEKKNPTTFNSTSGGTINVNGGGTIKFPANAMVNKITGAVYNGVVTIYSTWIDPKSNSVSALIPGALRGFNNLGNEKILESYGMIGAEMYDANNQPLQIASGQNAQITFPIPATLLGNAPSNIPLWYFNENNGMWQEQGTAQMQGGNYIGQVSHFTFWNCDQPIGYVHFEAIVNNTNGVPIPNVEVKVTNIINSCSRADYTNSSGKVEGNIPENANLLVEVIDNNCNILLYSNTLNTSTADVILDITATIPTINMVTVTGKLLNCSNKPVKNGFITFNNNYNTKIVKVSSNGNFVSSFSLCSLPSSCKIIAQDADTKVYGIYNNVSLTTGINNIGSMIACGNSSDQFLEWSCNVNGVTTNFSFNEANSGFYPIFNHMQTGIEVYDLSLTYFTRFTIARNVDESGLDTIINYTDHLENGIYVQNLKIPINVTNYDKIANIIEGNFQDSILGGAVNPTKYVSCAFRLVLK